MSRLEELARAEVRAMVERELGEPATGGLPGLESAVRRFFEESRGDVVTAVTGASFLREVGERTLSIFAADGPEPLQEESAPAPVAETSPVAPIEPIASPAGSVRVAFTGMARPTNPPRSARELRMEIEARLERTRRPQVSPPPPARAEVTDTPIDLFSTENEQPPEWLN